MQTNPVVRLSYRADIDGLRAIAVIAVVFFHAGVPFLQSGFVGVDIFFVISGFLIGGIILRETCSAKFSYAHFYLRRARRILPALFGVMAFVLLAGALVLSSAELRDTDSTLLSALLATSNLSFWRHQDYFDNSARFAPMLMTWSLSVEEQFYLVFPVLLIGLTRLSRRRAPVLLAASTVVLFGCSLWGANFHPVSAFYLLPFRAWELLTGATLAAYSADRFIPAQSRPVLMQAGAIAGVILMAAAIGWPGTGPFPNFAVMLAVLGAAAVIATRDSPVHRVLASRPIVFIGLVSYSWYLWHWPVMSLLRVAAAAEPGRWSLAAAVVLSLGIAILSWRFIEQPFRRGRASAPGALLGYAGALGVMLVVAAGIKLLDGVPQRLDPAVAELEHSVAVDLRGGCLADLAVSDPDFSPRCSHSVAGRPSIALIGDSHAAVLGSSFLRLAVANETGFLIAMKASCGPLPGVTIRYPTVPDFGERCASFTAKVIRYVLDDPQIAVVVLAARWKGYNAAPGALAGSLQALIRTLQDAGKRVIVAGDVPEFAFRPDHVALAEAIPLRGMLARLLWAGERYPSDGVSSETRAEAPATADLARIVTQAGATFVATRAALCDGETCRFSQDGKLLYFDSQHLSAVGADLVVALLASSIVATLPELTSPIPESAPHPAGNAPGAPLPAG